MKKKLYAVTVIFNPAQFKSRYKLYHEFAERCQNQGIILHTVEAIFEDQHFQVTDKHNPNHTRLYAKSELWHKERMINIGIRNLPSDAEYIAWLDADVLFCNPSIVQDTIDALNNHDIVQMFSTTCDLSAKHEPMLKDDRFHYRIGYVSAYYNLGYPLNKDLSFENSKNVGHTGYAWAIRKSTFEKIGGLLDFAILGSGDRYMANAFVGGVKGSLADNNSKFSKDYNDLLNQYGHVCEHAKLSVGFVEGLLLHYFHGSKANRQYGSRADILYRNHFEPSKDIEENGSGLYKFVEGNKPELEEEIRQYFINRKEDE